MNDIQEIEEWQILDEDYNGNTGSCIDKTKPINEIKNNSRSKLSVKSDIRSKNYIEIDPLAAQERLSPTLVYLCTAIYSLLPLASVIATFLIILLLFTRLYFLSLLYATYVFLDRQTCNRGGRRFNFIHGSKFWTYLAAYFPIKLRHKDDFQLDPKKNYILNYHPHGISAFGAVTTFATNGLNFNKLFPGITARFMVHEASFVVPIMKETFSMRGDCSVNSKSIDHMLTKRSTGNLLTIVVGGLAEADLSDEEVLKIVVAERKGFVKKALIHGADIVPCIAFGENSVFKRVELDKDSFLHKLETKWYNIFKFKHPIYYGRGLFSDKLTGVMPFKRPITLVMGNPISVKLTEQPSQEEINRVHANYLEQVKAIYEENQDLCEKYDKRLELV